MEKDTSTAYCGRWPPDKRCKAKNLWKAGTRIVKASATGKKVRVSKEVQNERIEICKSCEKYDQKRSRCKLCGCFLSGVAAKTAWATERCPLKPPKWDRVEI